MGFATLKMGSKDKTAQRLILRRVGRLREGNFGDVKALSGYAGLKELRIPYGPGYRVYYTSIRGKVILLLGGGTKRTQTKDIERARKYLLAHKGKQ